LNEKLGSQMIIDIIKVIKYGNIQIFDTDCTLIIDYFWDKHYLTIWVMNIIYLIYPIVLTVMVTNIYGELNQHAPLALIITIPMIIFRIVQLNLQGVKNSNKNVDNILHSIGIVSVFLFYSMSYFVKEMDMFFLI